MMQKMGVLVLLAAVGSILYMAQSSVTGEAKSGSVIFTNKGPYKIRPKLFENQPAPPYSIAKNPVMVDSVVHGDGGDFCFQAFYRAPDHFVQRTYCFGHLEKAQNVARQMRPSVVHVSEVFSR